MKTKARRSAKSKRAKTKRRVCSRCGISHGFHRKGCENVERASLEQEIELLAHAIARLRRIEDKIDAHARGQFGFRRWKEWQRWAAENPNGEP